MAKELACSTRMSTISNNVSRPKTSREEGEVNKKGGEGQLNVRSCKKAHQEKLGTGQHRGWVDRLGEESPGGIGSLVPLPATLLAVWGVAFIKKKAS